MTHVLRAWRTPRKMAVFVLMALLGVATLVVLPRETVVVQGQTRQTQMIGKDRLVSIDPLPETNGPMCEYPEAAGPQLMASLQPSSLMASGPRQQRVPAGTTTSAPARPGDALKAEISKRQPVSTLRDPRNAYAGLFVDPARNE